MEPMDKLKNILQEQAETSNSQPAEANQSPSWDEVCKYVGYLYLDSLHKVSAVEVSATEVITNLHEQIDKLKRDLTQRDNIIMRSKSVNDGDGKGS